MGFLYESAFSTKEQQRFLYIVGSGVLEMYVTLARSEVRCVMGKYHYPLVMDCTHCTLM